MYIGLGISSSSVTIIIISVTIITTVRTNKIVDMWLRAVFLIHVSLPMARRASYFGLPVLFLGQMVQLIMIILSLTALTLC